MLQPGVDRERVERNSARITQPPEMDAAGVMQENTPYTAAAGLRALLKLPKTTRWPTDLAAIGKARLLQPDGER